MGCRLSNTPWPHFTPGKDPLPIVQESGWATGPVGTGEKSSPHRDSIPDRPSRSSVATPTELPVFCDWCVVIKIENIGALNPCHLWFNLLTPNDDYSGRTTPLTSKCFILYIYSTNIGTEYFKHVIYSPFFPLQNAVCFIILTYLFPVLFTFCIQDVLKLKKNNSGAKRLTLWRLKTTIVVVPHR